MGPIGHRETSVRNHHYSLRNDPEERSSQLHRGGSLKSRNEMDYLVLVLKFLAEAKKIHTGPVTHCDSYLLGKGFSSAQPPPPVTKPPVRHTDLSSPSIAKFKNAHCYTYSPPYSSVGLHSNSLNFTLIIAAGRSIRHRRCARK
jgi:hypothetical protein